MSEQAPTKEKVTDSRLVTKDGVHVRVGQVWRDLDVRMLGRTRCIVEVDAFRGKVKMATDGQARGHSWVSIHRMHRHATGWQMVTQDLLPCPFCGGEPRWCTDEEHTCHRIICSACMISIDFNDDPDGVETVEDLQGLMAANWNSRAAPEPAAESKPIPKTYVDRIHDAEQTVVGDVWTKRRKPEHFVEVLGRKPPGTLILRHWNGRVTNKWYAYLASDYELTIKRPAQPPGDVRCICGEGSYASTDQCPACREKP